MTSARPESRPTPGVYARTYRHEKPTDVHRCQTCGAKHRHPKAYRTLVALAWCAVLAPIQILAGLALDGWLSWALLAIAARNIALAVLLIVGLAQLVDDNDHQDAQVTR